MKNKLFKVLSVILIFSTLLVGCNKTEEPADIVEETVTMVEPTYLENLSFENGRTIVPEDVIALTGTETNILFIDSTGTATDTYTVPADVTGEQSCQLYISYQDGSEYMGAFNFTVAEGTVVEEPAPVVESNEGIKVFTCNGIDNVSSYYEKDSLITETDNSYMKRTDTGSVTVSYTEADVKQDYVVSLVEFMSSVKMSAEEFNPENSWIEGKQYKSYNDYSKAFDDMLANFQNLYTTEAVIVDSVLSESAELGNFEAYRYMYKFGEMFVPIGVTNIVFTLPNGGHIVCMGVVDEFEGSYVNEAGETIAVTTEPTQLDIMSADYNMEHPAVKAYFDALAVADKNALEETVKVAKRLVYGKVENNVTVVGSNPAQEAVTPSQVLEETTAISGTSIDDIEEIVIDAPVNRSKTYAERYPDLYKWPDQQEIYGISPKKLVYSVLSSYDAQGQVSYESALVPMWSTTLNKFLNETKFGVNANNTSHTTGYGQNPIASQPTEPEVQEEPQSVVVDTDNLNKKSLVTNFGDYNVVEYQGLLLLNESTTSDVHVRSEATGKVYHVRATTSAAIQQARAGSIYDIKGDPTTWVSAKGNATVTSSGTTVTPYTMTYSSLEDGSQVTADYIYTVQSNGGYFIIYGETAPTEINNDMLNIANAIEEATNG